MVLETLLVVMVAVVVNRTEVDVDKAAAEGDEDEA